MILPCRRYIGSATGKADTTVISLEKQYTKRGLYKKEWFVETEPVPFEKISLRVPKGLHEFLTERFGNYMIPPSEDRIKWEQHAKKWDAEKDFSEYINPERDFSDEKYLV